MHSNRAALADKLTSQGGENAFGNQQDAHARTQGIDGSNDRCENKFARGDFVMRTYRKISILNASGIIQQGSAHDFDRELKIVSDRRKRKAPSADTEPDEVRPCGFFWTLGVKFRAALVTVRQRQKVPARLHNIHPQIEVAGGRRDDKSLPQSLIKCVSLGGVVVPSAPVIDIAHTSPGTFPRHSQIL